jgi:hypothetical protein
MDGEVEFLEALVETLTSSRPGSFDVAGMLFSAEVLEGLSTFGDSLLGALFFARESEGIS